MDDVRFWPKADAQAWHCSERFTSTPGYGAGSDSVMAENGSRNGLL